MFDSPEMLPHLESRPAGPLAESRHHRGTHTVLIACNAWFHDQIGGSNKLATEFAVHLSRLGYHVAYVCGANDVPRQNPTIEEGVHVWRYPYPRATSPDPRNIWGHVHQTYQLTRQLMSQNNVVAVNGHTPLQHLGASLASRKHHVRAMYSVHSPFVEELSSNWQAERRSLRKGIALRIANFIERSNCHRATTVQCDSRFTLETMRTTYPKQVNGKGKVSPGWVDVHRYAPVQDILRTRQQLGAPWQSSAPLFFTVRRLENRMGLENLIDAARQLVNQQHEFRLLVGGSGSLRPRLESQVNQLGLENHVNFLGRVSDDDLPLCFAAADCFVLPTTALECFGLITLESYACGTPVIATPVGAIPELMIDDKWLTAETSPQAIAQRMEEFLQGRLEFDSVQIRSHAENWSAERGLQRLSTLLLDGHHASRE